MELIRRDICDFIDDSDFWTDQKLAAEADITKQQFSKYRKTGKGLGFRKILSIAHILFKESADLYISKWCLRFDSTEIIRQAFEYAYTVRNKELLKSLLEKHKNEIGLIGECVKVYSIISMYINKEIKFTDLKAKVNQLKSIKDKSLLILIELIKLYYYYHTNQFLLLLERAEELEIDIFSLSDERQMFIKECYILRICEVLAPANFHANNLMKTKFYSNVLINSKICPKTVSDGYYYIGMTYLIEDKNKCLDALRLSYEVLSDSDVLNKKQALYNLNFCLAYYGEDLVDEKTCASSLLALKFARKGEEELALKYVDKAVFEEGESNYKKYYYALAIKSKIELGKVAADFFKVKNLFFYSVVANELKGLGEDTSFIDSLTKLSIGKGEILDHEKNSFSCFSDINSYGRVS